MSNNMKNLREVTREVWSVGANDKGWPGDTMMFLGAALRIADSFESAAKSLAIIASNSYRGSSLQETQLAKKSLALRKARAEVRRLNKALTERNKEGTPA